MIADSLKSQVYPVRTKITATKQILTLHLFNTDESKLKYLLVEETLSQICSTGEDESKVITVDKCSTEED